MVRGCAGIRLVYNWFEYLKIVIGRAFNFAFVVVSKLYIISNWIPFSNFLPKINMNFFFPSEAVTDADNDLRQETSPSPHNPLKCRDD